MLVAGKHELRQHKPIFVVADQEVSDNITVNCTPPV